MPLTLFIIALIRTCFFLDYQFSMAVRVSGDQHFSDPMGNVYITLGNTLNKYSAEQEKIGHYTNAYLGNIFSVDVSDPLRILIYYKDYNQVVWVDNFLSEIRSPVWLDDLGLNLAELVCSSSQGGFWVFNSLNNQLQYYSADLQLRHESPSLNILTGPDIHPMFMIEKNLSLYLNVPGMGILVFDRFGNYSKTLQVETPSVFQVTDRHVYYMGDGELRSYDLRMAETTSLDLPADYPERITGLLRAKESGNPEPLSGEPVIHAELQPGRLFIYSREGYLVYKSDR